MDTEIEECGLPHWLVDRMRWSNMDNSLRIESIKGSTRRVNMIVNNDLSNTHSTYQHWNTRTSKKLKSKSQNSFQKSINKKRRKSKDHNWSYDKSDAPDLHEDPISSQITCHTIVEDEHFRKERLPKVKLTAYQKLGW